MAEKKRVRSTKPVLKNHNERERIEADLLRGVPVRVVGKKFGVSKDVCYRFLNSVPGDVRAKKFGEALRPGASLDEIRTEESEGLLIALRTQRLRLLQCQDMALELADAEMVTRLSGQIHTNLQLVGRYLGEFVSLSKIEIKSLVLTPQYVRLRCALLGALSRHPDARSDVLRALREIEDSEDAAPAALLPALDLEAATC